MSNRILVISEIFHRGTSITLVGEEGDPAQELTPVVCYAEGLGYGFGLAIGDELGIFQRAGDPCDLIAVWRRGEILASATDPSMDLLLCAVNAAERHPDGGDVEAIELVKIMIGDEAYATVMEQHVPHALIQALLDGQSREDSPDLYTITKEVRAGTVAWWPQFNAAGVKHPDLEDVERREADAILMQYEEELISYAKALDVSLKSEFWNFVKAALVKMVRADTGQSKVVVVALAGVIAKFTILYEVARATSPDEEDMRRQLAREVREGIQEAARWLQQVTAWRILGVPIPRVTLRRLEGGLMVLFERHYLLADGGDGNGSAE